jgi:O-antigen ligase
MTTIDGVRILAIVRQHPAMIGLAFCLGIGGLIAGILGSAWGAVAIALAIGLIGFIDRRLALLATLAVLPSLTAFNNESALTIRGSVLDFRLLMTGCLAVLLVVWWLAVERPRLDRIDILFAALVVTLIVLTPLNRQEPLKALPVIGRYVDYFLVLVAARSWFRGEDSRWLVPAAIVIGAIPPAASAGLQLVLGQAREQNDALRLTGLYGSSPVGLALEMQLAGLLIAASGIYRKARPELLFALSVVGVIVFGLVIVATSTRLVFASFIAGLVVIEMVHRRWAAIPIVLAAAAVVLVVQPGLAQRLVSTGQVSQPQATPETIVVPGQGVIEIPGDQPEAGDASLRFRLFLWQSMVGEWAQSPILGRGTGSFAGLFQARTGIARVAPHNDYLGVLVEDGLPGIVLFVALQVAVLLALLRRFVDSRRASNRNLASGVLLVFGVTNVLNAINNPILFLDLQVALWALVGTALSLPETVFGWSFLRWPTRRGDEEIRLDGASSRFADRDGGKSRRQPGRQAPISLPTRSSAIGPMAAPATAVADVQPAGQLPPGEYGQSQRVFRLAPVLSPFAAPGQGE